MACGTPVVSARAGSLPEVAGDAALYVDPNDIGSIMLGLQQILADDALRRTLSSRGLTRARLFEARKTAVRVVDLLEEIACKQAGD
jgi:glycosyltransferase involved in cell wall biosynthesis